MTRYGLVAVLAIYGNWGMAQVVVAPQDPVLQFEAQVSLIEAFFATPQKMLLTNSGSDGSGKYSYLARYTGAGVKYDVRKTDSLVSPLTGQISVTMKADTNEQCGNRPFLQTHIGWRNEGEAIASSTREDCFGGRRPSFEATFTYAFQKGKWVFKSVTGRYLDEQTGKVEPLLTATLGAPAANFVPVTTDEGKAYNSSWQKAFLP